MIGRALDLHLPLIDMTPSVTAVHQNHDYRHVPGARAGSAWEGPEADRNRSLAVGIERYKHNPYNATLLLTPQGLCRPGRSSTCAPSWRPSSSSSRPRGRCTG